MSQNHGECKGSGPFRTLLAMLSSSITRINALAGYYKGWKTFLMAKRRVNYFLSPCHCQKWIGDVAGICWCSSDSTWISSSLTWVPGFKCQPQLRFQLLTHVHPWCWWQGMKRAADDSLNTWVSATHMENLDWVLGFWLYPGPALAAAGSVHLSVWFCVCKCLPFKYLK